MLQNKIQLMQLEEDKMIGSEIIKYSLKNITKRKTRSFLTIISILIGIATIFIFLSFGLGLYNYVNQLSTSSSADKLIIQSKAGFGGLDTTFALDDDDLDAVKKTSGVFDATGTIFQPVEVQVKNEKKYAYLVAYDPKKPLIMDVSNVGVEEGRELRSGDKRKVILGYNYKIKDKIFSKPLNLNDKIKVNGIDFKVVGFLEKVGSSQDDSNVYASINCIDELFPNKTLNYNWVIAKVDLKTIDATAERIKKNLRKERGLEEGKEDFFVQSFEDFVQGFSTALDLVIGFVILIALISVIVSAVNTTNTMITSVLERVKEIGTIKSIGAKNIDIFNIFLFESAFLGFVAGVIGVSLGWILSYIGGNILDNLGYGFLQPLFNVWLFVGCIAFATITGAISGVAPAIRASKINPVDALRYE